MPQTASSTRYEERHAEEVTARAAVVVDINDQLDVICGFAALGAEASYEDADRTESFFTRIESAGERAGQITRQLLELDSVRPAEEEDAIDSTTDARGFVSSFRRRLTAARAQD